MENEDLRTLNNVGERIRWARQCLGLSMRIVSIDTSISLGSLFERETGARARYFEEYKVLAEYFSEKWKSRYHDRFPKFHGIEIKAITTMWIMFGER